MLTHRPGLSSFAAGHNVDFRAQTFIAPGEIKRMTMTTSKYGVTAKDLVCECTMGNDA